MNDADKDRFSETLAAVAGFFGIDLPIASAAIYWSALLEYELFDIHAAITAHIKDPEHGRFMPKPADVIRHIPGKHTIMGADAAWEVAMKSRLWDEAATIVVPAAVFRAFPFATWAMGDKVGARMAFRDAWPAAVKRHGMSYTVSEGLDPAGREPAIMEALRSKLISSRLAQAVLPDMAEEIAALAAPDAPLLANERNPSC